MGFSQKTGSPARAARPISSACAAVAAVMTTASTPQEKISSTVGAAVAPIRSASCAARCRVRVRDDERADLAVAAQSVLRGRCRYGPCR